MTHHLILKNGPKQLLQSTKGVQNEIVYITDEPSLYVYTNNGWVNICDDNEKAQLIFDNLKYRDGKTFLEN